MSSAPFADLRLKPGEKPSPERLAELFDGLTQNFEDLYKRYQTTEQFNEAAASSKTVKGSVTSAGAVGKGSGFTAIKTGTGIYEVTLTTELKTVGVMVATSLAAFLIPGVVANTKKVFQVQFKDGAGVLTNTAFNFIIAKS